MRRLIVYGSCQAQQLGRILESSPQVRSQYDVGVHWVGDQAAHGARWADEILAADVLLIQDVPELACFPSGYWARGTARIVTYPFLTLSALWPFDTAHGECDPALAAAQKQGRGLAFHFQDRLLARMRHQIPDRDERLAAYRSLSCGTRPDLAAFLATLDPVGHIARNLESLRRKDGLHHLTVGHAVAAQYRVARTFHSVAHPTIAVLARLAGKLMGKLGISLEPDCLPADDFQTLQVPIHPIVSRALGLYWVPNRPTWNIHGEKLSFEQYYGRYIDVFG